MSLVRLRQDGAAGVAWVMNLAAGRVRVLWAKSSEPRSTKGEPHVLG
jgi:hypothetical protein